MSSKRPEPQAVEGPNRLSQRSLASLLRDHEGASVQLCSKTQLDDDVAASVRTLLCDAANREIALEVTVVPTMDAGAVLYIGDDGRIVLDPRTMWLSEIERTLRDRVEAGELLSVDDTYEWLRAELAKGKIRPHLERLLDAGRTLRVGDGVAMVAGLRDVGATEIVRFAGGVEGIALSLHEDRVGVALLGDERQVREGCDVVRSGHLMRVPVGEALLGRVIDALGRPLDEKGPITPDAWMPVERAAPRVVDRQPVDTPLHTGIKIIDALVPIGRGQRELIIGDRKIGKTSIAIDTILAQKGAHVPCVYCAIGQKASTVREVIGTLEQQGALSYTAVVAALPSDMPAMRYLAPYTACALGEYFMDHGRAALVVYDDLTKHAVTYREISALLDRPVGREAYPGDVFYLHSRLLERAARLSDERGGGSLTALPVVETLAGDISAFIPTNVISICDGQIMLDEAAFNEGRRPAMDSGLSVSRVGGSAQTRLMKRIAGRLRIDLAQYEEMARFVKFGAEVDEATRLQLHRGERARELLKQPLHAPMSLAEECVVLFGAVQGLFDDVPIERLAEAERGLLAHLRVHRPEVLRSLASAPDVDQELEAMLQAAIGEYLASSGLLGTDEPEASVSLLEAAGMTSEVGS